MVSYRELHRDSVQLERMFDKVQACIHDKKKKSKGSLSRMRRNFLNLMNDIRKKSPPANTTLGKADCFFCGTRHERVPPAYLTVH